MVARQLPGQQDRALAAYRRALAIDPNRSDTLYNLGNLLKDDDPEEAERWLLLAPERTSEKPEEILLGDRGIRYTLLAWLFTVVLVGLCHRADLLPEGALQL